MQTDWTIYHNPRCSKSRATLALLEERGITPRVILYLDRPPSQNELAAIAEMLAIAPHALLRTKEPEYKTAELTPESSADAIYAAISRFPKLLERPIVVRGDRARVGRPPENVLELFE
jgi:arsenate reductase